MGNERRQLDELLVAVEARLTTLFGVMARDLATLIRRAPKDATGTLSPVGRRGVASWLTDTLAALFGSSPTDAETLYATVGTVPHLLAASTRAAAKVAVGPTLTDVSTRLAGQPTLLAALVTPTGQRKPTLDPSRSWVDPNGYKLSDRIWQNGTAVRAQIDTLLDHGIRSGASAVDIAGALEGFLTDAGRNKQVLVRQKDGTMKLEPRPIVTSTPYGTSGLANPRRLARTEVTRAYGSATIEAAKVNPFVAGLQWRVSGNHPETDECDANASADSHGLGAGVYPVGSVPRYPNHPNCFPAGTVVSGPQIVASTERWYVGDVVEIETVGGHVLTVTPNHPILTPHGWVAAGLLHEGGNVISGSNPQGMSDRVNPDNQYVEALIEEVAVTLGGALTVATMRVPTAPEDFHHDGANSQVSIVRTNRHLRDALDPSLLQPALQGQFAGGNTQLPFLPGERAFALRLPSLGRATNSRVGSGGLGHALLRSHFGQLQPLRFGASSRSNAGGYESLTDSVSCDPEPFRQRQFGLTRKIEGGDRINWERRQRGSAGIPSFAPGNLAGRRNITPAAARLQFGAQPLLAGVVAAGSVLARLTGLVGEDRILNVRRRCFSGHVYNLQTSESWYSANGIITHNCRCVLSPQVISDSAAQARIAAIAAGGGDGLALDEGTLVSAVTGF